MKGTKESNKKMRVGVHDCAQKGITLIALVITIIVMLILVGATISMAVNGGLFDYAGKAVGDTKNALNEEERLSNGAIQVDGVWYDSIDDYINKKPSANQGEGETGGEEGPISITLSIAGTKVETVPVPTGFTHTEGTIDTGYVIQDASGNEFVWVPVDKNQKITLNVESEKDVTALNLYDPYGDLILNVADGDIETTYNNTEINPTVNGMYIAVATTEDGITQKTLTVKSLYAFDTLNDWYTTDEYAKTEGFNTIQDYTLDMLSKNSIPSIEALLQSLGAPTLEVAISKTNTLQIKSWKKYTDLEDYIESINKNGGFYIGRYEAGSPIARTNGSDTATVEEIKAANGVPVSKGGYIPYNFVTHDQAKGLAESMYATNDNYEVSLITGSGWDRTLGWINETGSKSTKEIAGDSVSWGNYKNAEFEITKGKYSENDGGSYIEVSGTYKKTNESSILLTTGATTRNAVKNIFDLAGNLWEYTNEAFSTTQRVRRGGLYEDEGSYRPGAHRNRIPASQLDNCGFRAALYVK